MTVLVTLLCAAFAGVGAYAGQVWEWGRVLDYARAHEDETVGWLADGIAADEHHKRRRAS